MSDKIIYKDINDLSSKVAIGENSEALIFDVQYELISDVDIQAFRVHFKKGVVKAVSGMLAEKCIASGKGHIKLYKIIKKKTDEEDAIKKLVQEELAKAKVEPEVVEKIAELTEEPVVEKRTVVKKKKSVKRSRK